MSLDALTDAEKEKLAQLQAITNGADVDTQISLLQSVDWDLQAALQAIYGEERPNASVYHSNNAVEEQARLLEPMEVDDSLVFDAQSRPTYPSFRSGMRGVGIFSLLTAPFSFTLGLLASLFHYVFRVLRIPFPRLNTLSLSLNRSAGGRGGGRRRRGSHSDDPSVVAERWVRELEEETGAVCISKAALMEAQAEGDEAGPSNRPVRRHPVKAKTLPDFFLGGYDAALKAAEREARVLCVIITSEEHDDSPAFRKEVLTDPEFVHALTDNRVMVWGGDVRDRDGYQASMKLGATTYPFVAFSSLYGRPHGPDRMSVISRHSGSPTSITSAETLTGHLTNLVLPRVAPVLRRKQAETQSREYERRLREEQDRAYAEAQHKDYERIMKRRQEEEQERREEERRRMEAEEREELLRYEAAQRKRRAGERMAWRRYARRALVPPEIPGSKSAMPIRFRMPSGKLIVRKFEPTDTITGLYAFVASQFIPDSETPDGDPYSPPCDEDDEEAAEFDLDGYDWDWEFQVAVAFPKQTIPWERGSDKKIGSISALKGGANVVVEMKASEDDDKAPDTDDDTPSEDSL
ncbi:hypothetical protein FRC14_004783 [Serendipita sp. 396]|nr:hypothetical protein FRC14_004783 [Serendipita sp. 396]KAG8789336.1 hypothetical protein FRC15_009388 [Serendipita sp. 397]KAG8804570.1 hypothetical protein FRC16_006012 [Serendipita sp. 398]KAG8825213.1 hypothetical protein FRC19_011889 [Serendipita sp. 401]KAG8878691.1 hypothetical protein FRC20_006368 [Serendipita sp. 405]KAG9056226.1 hypothetical protein FS842_011325 [Serendipita sp. 407]